MGISFFLKPIFQRSIQETSDGSGANNLDSLTYTLLLRGFMICTLMVSGLEIRMNRIMNQGRMLCIPMDHGISNGPIPGLEDPHGAIAKCANHGLTSVIINKGVLKSMPKPTRIGILVHFSSSTSL